MEFRSKLSSLTSRTWCRRFGVANRRRRRVTFAINNFTAITYINASGPGGLWNFLRNTNITRSGTIRYDCDRVRIKYFPLRTIIYDSRGVATSTRVGKHTLVPPIGSFTQKPDDCILYIFLFFSTRIPFSWPMYKVWKWKSWYFACEKNIKIYHTLVFVRLLKN